MSSFPLAAKQTNRVDFEISPGPGQYNIPETLDSGVPVIHGHAVTDTDINTTLNEDQKRMLRKAVRAYPREGPTMSDEDIARNVMEYNRIRLEALGDDATQIPLPSFKTEKVNKNKKTHNAAPKRLGAASGRGAWLWLKPQENLDSILTTSRTIQPEPGAYDQNFKQVHPRVKNATLTKSRRFQSTDLQNDHVGVKYNLPSPNVQSQHKSLHAASFDYHFRGDVAREQADAKRRSQLTHVGPSTYEYHNTGNRFGKIDHGVPRAVIGPVFRPRGPAVYDTDGETLLKHGEMNTKYGISERFPMPQHQPYFGEKLVQGRLGEASPGPCYAYLQNTMEYNNNTIHATNVVDKKNRTIDIPVHATVGTQIARKQTQQQSQTVPVDVLSKVTVRHNKPMVGLPPAETVVEDRGAWLRYRNVKTRAVTNTPSQTNDVKRRVVVESCAPGPSFNTTSTFKMSLREIGQMRMACRLRNAQLRHRALNEEEAGRREFAKQEKKKENF